MMRLEGGERLILQTIQTIQGDSGNYVADTRIAQESDLALDDVRNWLLVLQNKELVSVVVGENGLRGFVEAKGVLALKQSLPFTLKRIEDEQKQQRKEMEMIRFIISHMITGYEITHLERLVASEPFSFERRISFDQELRHLRALGFIENLPGISPSIAQLPHQATDLRDYFQITERGRQYLMLRKEGADGEESTDQVIDVE